MLPDLPGRVPRPETIGFYAGSEKQEETGKPGTGEVGPWRSPRGGEYLSREPLRRR
ncbi:MAG: hypothetical protein WC993_06295 [Methanoculleus sp.]